MATTRLELPTRDQLESAVAALKRARKGVEEAATAIAEVRGYEEHAGALPEGVTVDDAFLGALVRFMLDVRDQANDMRELMESVEELLPSIAWDASHA
jgi:hypothetical protein